MTQEVLYLSREDVESVGLSMAGVVDAVEAVFRETTSIGVRFYPVGRRVLERDFRTVRVGGEKIGIKIAALGGTTVNVQPEYRDLLKASRRSKRPLKEIAHLAVCAYAKKR